MAKNGARVAVVVPNWNGASNLKPCLDSLLAQSLKAHVIMVDNGSVDNSVELVKTRYPEVELILHDKNRGFAGGVNPGFKKAIQHGFTYVAPFNNDAVADKHWLENLVAYLDENPRTGIAACKFMSADGKHLDSTGDYYTVWGLPYPRGRGETTTDKYDDKTDVFGASGGASLYRVKTLEEVGLFDEDFFAYYEDVDLSFRAQLAGWKVSYVPSSVAYHEIGATSRKVKGFTTYQTMKNLQLLHYKNVPRAYFWKIGWRLTLASSFFILRSISRGQGLSAIRGDLRGSWLVMKKRGERQKIQKTRTVSDEYIWNIIVHDLPPNARALRKLRRFSQRLRGKKS